MKATEFTERLLAKGETRHAEFKSSAESKELVARAVCAFLNTEGGFVVVGVDEEGKPTGSATEDLASALRTYLRRTITPQVLLDVAFERISGSGVITVNVPAGQDRPYVFDGRVFIRDGRDTLLATASDLRDLMEATFQDTPRWERRASLGLEIDGVDRPLLTETVRRAQERRGYPFDQPKAPLAVLEQLSLVQSGQLTNAADVLFGQRVALRHPQTRLRAVSYSTDRAGDFLDEQLFEGPAFRLLEDAMAFLKRHVSIGAEFTEGKLPRQSKPKYPFHALREGLVNALVHRDYASFSGSVSVSVYPDRVEIWNTGRLPKGLSPRDLRLASHASILVNPDIGHVFYLHELMERVGRGTYKIVQECLDAGMRLPEWRNISSGVRLTMFAAKAGASTESELNDRQQEFLDASKPGEEIRVAEYLDRFGHGVSDRQARRDLKDLEAYGFLVRHGAGSKTTYKRTDQPH